MPVAADKTVYFLAPIISAIPAFLAFSVIPFGGEVSIFGHPTVLQLTDLPVGVLVVLACSSVGVYGIVLGGWASGSTYPLLAALRSAAQMISYEVAMGLSIVAVFLYAGSLSTSDIVGAQASGWFGWLLIPSFVIFVIAMVGETNRAPFDLPEAESELVGGFHTEYSSFKFALFFLAEYVNMVTVSAMATTLFLGGGQWPWPLSFLDGSGWLQFVAFLIKMFIFLFVFVWLRGTLPRLRYDQFMRLGWKVLVPLNLVWILVVFALRTYRTVGSGDVTVVLLTLGIVVAAVLVVAFLVPDRHRPEAPEVELAVGLPGAPAGSRGPRPVPAAPPRGRGGARPARPSSTSGARHRRGRRARRAFAGLRELRRFHEGERVDVRLRQGLRRHLLDDVQEGVHRGVPGRLPAGRAALPRPARAQPAPGRAGEVRRLRAVRLGLPGRRHLRRGRRQHRGGRASRRVSGTARSTRSTTCAASSAACASRPARPGR